METIHKNDLLKIIAMMTMLVDHIGLMFFPEYRIFRTIGRIAFPIFAFYLAIGFQYTSNRRKYLIRLSVLGLVSQLPYMFLYRDLSPRYLEFNVVILFVYALGMLYLLEQTKNTWERGRYHLANLYGIAAFVVILLPEIMTQSIDGFYLSYGTYGLVMIALFYYFFKKPFHLIGSYIIFSFVFAYLYGVDIVSSSGDVSYISALFQFKQITTMIIEYNDGLRLLQGYFFQARSIMAVVLILLLSTFRLDLKLHKYASYIFYPVHMGLIVLIAYFLS